MGGNIMALKIFSTGNAKYATISKIFEAILMGAGTVAFVWVSYLICVALLG